MFLSSNENHVYRVHPDQITMKNKGEHSMKQVDISYGYLEVFKGIEIKLFNFQLIQEII